MVTKTGKTTKTTAVPPKPEPDVDAPNPAGGASMSPNDKPPFVVVRRKEMVERIAARSGMKPNVIKNVLDAILVEMGDALSGGEALNLPPLGKIRVNKRKDVKNAEVMICKLRRNTPKPPDILSED